MTNLRGAVLIALGGLLAGMLALGGCAIQAIGGGRDSSAAQPVFHLEIAAPQAGVVPLPDNPVKRLIEAYTHTRLDMKWIPSAVYGDQTNMMLATGKMPQVVNLSLTPATIQAIREGTFWEIGPLLGKYPNLSAVHPQYYESISVDGGIYGIPLFRPMARTGVIYREDWFEELGLQAPATMDQWRQVLSAIAGSGDEQRFGMMLDEEYHGMFWTRFVVSQGGPNQWAVENGQFVPAHMTQTYRDVMGFFRELYDAGLINRDFAFTRPVDVDRMWNEGRLGIRIAVATSAAAFHDSVSARHPQAATGVSSFAGPSGIRVPMESGNWGFYALPRSRVTTGEELAGILTFFDKLHDPDMATLLYRGIEGIHYELVAGEAVWTQLDQFQEQVKPYRDRLPALERQAIPIKRDSLGAESWRIVEDNDRFAVADPSQGLVSLTYMEKGRELDAIVTRALTRYIMGEIDDAGWDAEMEKWMAYGGAAVIEQYSRAYMNKD